MTHTLIHPQAVRHDDTVDGGTRDNMRPTLNDSRYEAMLADKATVEPDLVVTVAVERCESGDMFVRDGRVREIVARETREDVLRLQRPLHQ